MSQSSGTPAERRNRPRLNVSIPASIKISTSDVNQPFDPRDALICDITEGGFGLSVTVEAGATREEVSKMLVHRRSCCVDCRFPNAQKDTRLFGDIMWVEPHITPTATLLRFGVSLDIARCENLGELHRFLKTASANRTNPMDARAVG